MEQKKKCKCSPIAKPLSEFYRRKVASDGKDCMCKKCRREMSDKYHKKNISQWMDGVIF